MKVVLQPNGLFAVWSDIVDSFVDVNLDPGEVLASVRMSKPNVSEQAVATSMMIAISNGTNDWVNCLKLISHSFGMHRAMEFFSETLLLKESDESKLTGNNTK